MNSGILCTQFKKKFLTGARYIQFTERPDLIIAGAWCIVFCGLTTHFIFSPLRLTTFDVYRDGGSAWLTFKAIYKGGMGFVYSPIIAALFSSFSRLPRLAGEIVWLLLNQGCFVFGLRAMLKCNLISKCSAAEFITSNLLLMPLAIGNLDVAQANPFVIGLLMYAVATARREQWAATAILVSVAGAFKIYPLSVGLLIALMAPSRYSAYLVSSVLALILLPFAFRPPEYVGSLYHAWISTRFADNRLEYSARHAPLDLWLALNQFGGWHLSESCYRCIQMGGGAAIALYVVVARTRKWGKGRVLVGIFTFGCIWMTLLGPATEGFTYILLAPPAIFVFLEVRAQKQPFWLKFLLYATVFLLLTAIVKNSFVPSLRRSVPLRLMQPVAALLFLSYCLGWIFNGLYWNVDGSLAQTRK